MSKRSSTKKDKMLASKKAQHQKLFEEQISRNPDILRVYKEADTDFDESINFDEFTEALEKLLGEDNNLDFKEASAAYKKLDPDMNEGLDLEAFRHGVCMAIPVPSNKLVWTALLAKGKYQHPAHTEDRIGFDDAVNILIGEFSWREKTKALRGLLDILVSSSTKETEVQKLLRQLVVSSSSHSRAGFKASLYSKVPMVAMETCLVLAAVMKARKNVMKGLAPVVMKLLWEVVDKREFGIGNSAAQCLKVISKFVPDDANKSQLKVIVQGCSLDDYETVVKCSFDCLKILLKQKSNTKSKKGAKEKDDDKEFFNRLKTVLREKLGSSSKGEVRRLTFDLLQCFEKANPLEALKVTSTFKKELADEYLAFTEGGGVKEEEEKENAVEEKEEKGGDWYPKTKDELLRDRDFTTSDYKECKNLLNAMFDEFDRHDHDGELFNAIEANRCIQYLRMVGISGKDSTVALRGIDEDKTGNIQKKAVVDYCLSKNTKLVDNLLLNKKANQWGWKGSRVDTLKARKTMFEQLLELEVKEFNTSGEFRAQESLDLLNYLIQKKTKK